MAADEKERRASISKEETIILVSLSSSSLRLSTSLQLVLQWRQERKEARKRKKAVAAFDSIGRKGTVFLEKGGIKEPPPPFTNCYLYEKRTAAHEYWTSLAKKRFNNSKSPHLRPSFWEKQNLE